ncbi:MAG: AraC family transcriptional regulator [Victivallaceae bacterium]|nr:AraC family transcriptional regulator [Victivallaceae bacterium]
MPNEKLLSCPVREISGVWRFERKAGFSGTTFSTPGHLVHYIVEGTENVAINKREFRAEAGAVIYYYEQEEVKTHFLNDTVFYSIAFMAPELPPLTGRQRVFKAEAGVADIFAGIYELYTAPSGKSSIRLFRLLLELLERLGLAKSAAEFYNRHEKLWHRIEARIRRERRFRIGIKEICSEFNLSPASLHRLCVEVSGKPPGKRLQQIRMEEAKALLMFSGLNVSEVAKYLGYPRIHEFSREFSACFKSPPSCFRHS